MSFRWRDLAPLVSPAAPPRRRRIIVSALILSGAIASFGIAPPRALAASEATTSVDADSARQFIEKAAASAIAVMADRTLSDADRDRQFRRIFDDTFDLPVIGQLVLGRYWAGASADQRARFLQLFEQQQVLVWAQRFKAYVGQKLVAESAEAATGSATSVSSRIDQPDGQPFRLQWIVARRDGAWKVDDILVGGASMALTLRQDYAGALQSSGGRVDGLLDMMQKKIGQLKVAG